MDGLAYLHDRGFAHRDLKVENILLDQNSVPKLADFGCLKKYKGDNASSLRTYCGTRMYFAPERIQGRGLEYNGEASDVYSLGVCLYTMLTGVFPCREALDKNYFSLMKDPVRHLARFKKSLEPEAIDLILGMLKQDAGARLTLTQIKQHEWMCPSPQLKIVQL